MEMKIKWSEGKWFPTLIKGGAMGIVDGTPVYVACVSYPWRESELSWYYGFDTGFDTLSATQLPHGLNDLRACIRDNIIYVVGGENSDVTTSNTTYAFMIGEVEE